MHRNNKKNHKESNIERVKKYYKLHNYKSIIIIIIVKKEKEYIYKDIEIIMIINFFLNNKILNISPSIINNIWILFIVIYCNYINSIQLKLISTIQNF